MKKLQGFSLIELMIAIGILGILVSVALPSYVNYVLRAKRADATAALMTAANTMERFRANNFSYAAAAAGTTFGNSVPLDGSGAQSYVLTLNSDATTYTITATSTGAQTDALGSVETLTINQNGVKQWTYQGSTQNCWPTRSKSC